MKINAAFLVASATTATAAVRPKNFIMIVPDGMAPASETLVRTYKAMLNGATPQSPNIPAIFTDQLPIGNTRTHSANNLVTDSAAAGTALATGFKTNNGAIGVLPDGQPVGTIMEAAKMEGFLTALVVTSSINHATPAAYSAHVVNRNAFPQIAEQQLGYSHPLNMSVDILLGGGRCYFQPSTNEDSCREDDIDLFKFAEEEGYTVAQDRAGFNDFESGTGSTRLPYIGLFKDYDLSYEIDRKQQPEAEREPSLAEMAQTALNSLDRELNCRGRQCSGRGKRGKGYFMMIEASRIDHSSHAHDAAAHLHDVMAYHEVIDLVKEWIDRHPDTAMLSVADHETGGLTLPGGYDPRALTTAQHSYEYLLEQWEGSDKSRDFLTGTILPAAGISAASTSDIDSILRDFAQLPEVLSRRAGIRWSTGGHSGVDTTLYGYAAGRMGRELKEDMAGGYDNTGIPRFLEKALGLDMDKVTRDLRAKGTGWIPQ
ncbi:Alkaline phosphatase [Cercospora beticola]|uniref:Alkaline phosphatase n=1 Tax=Cercospora beticola TaxID=122368 RepID=A0A2G5H9M5_CERBT|nr:Alkaline phosphatase [Cercospora beticola]PIA89236.1 Alkaline phosphatase [Cercospora beticola]WPB02795.1 hypothetical protein RHO25_007431 [Cercospora beticola]